MPAAFPPAAVRPYRCLRSLTTAAFGLLLAAGAQAQTVVLTPRANGAAPDLQCPRAATGTPPPGRPGPSAPSSADSQDPAPPDLDSVSEALDAAGLPPAPAADALPLVASGRPLRVALWGDSHAAANFFSETLADALGFAGDQALPSFIPASAGLPGVRLPIRKSCVSPQWTRSLAHRAPQEGAAFSRTLLSAQADRPGSYFWIDFRTPREGTALRALDVHYQVPTTERRTMLAVSVDGGPETIVALDPSRDGLLRIEPSEALATLKLRLIVGTLVLEGFAPQYAAAPALLLDTFAVPGATARGWRMIDPSYMQQHDAAAYDLVLLEYGTNEGNDPKFDPAVYANELRISLRNLRQVYPEAACVLLGPTDRGVLVPRRSAARKRGAGNVDLLRYSRVHGQISETQKTVGREFGCRFWNWQTAMGGPGGAYRWFYQDPRLMAPDLIHLTPLGYQTSARKFAAVLKLAPIGLAR